VNTHTGDPLIFVSCLTPKLYGTEMRRVTKQSGLRASGCFLLDEACNCARRIYTGVQLTLHSRARVMPAAA